MPHEAFSMLQDRMQIFKRRILRKKPNICPNICPDICQRCKKLEFDPGLVSSTDDFYHPVTRLKESGKDAMFKNDCVMCHALKSICPSEDGSWYACHVPNIMTQFDVQPIGNGKKLVLPQHLISRRWLAVDSHTTQHIFIQTDSWLSLPGKMLISRDLVSILLIIATCHMERSGTG